MSTTRIKTPHRVYWSTHSLGAALGVNPVTVARWCNEGKLQTIVTPGGHRRILHAQAVVLAKSMGHALPDAPPPAHHRHACGVCGKRLKV